MISIHPWTNNPTKVWEELKQFQHVMRFKVKNPVEAPLDSKIRLVCMSDTHSLTSHIKMNIPDGDVFIHAGDFTRSGSLREIQEFNDWLGKLPHKYKLVIAGNHELTMDPNFSHEIQHRLQRDDFCNEINNKNYTSIEDSQSFSASIPHSKEHILNELKNCIYLEDSSVVLYGLKFYGSPWQPEFGGWAFNLPRGFRIKEKWDLIPSDTDVLITHTPPCGYGDHSITGVRAGCVELLSTVQQRVKPKYHIYGHIHEGYGVRSDSQIIFINASTCNTNYMPLNKPIVADVLIPPGFHRNSS